MLKTVARDFVEAKFEKTNGVIGVLLTGSASIDYVDSLSDVDLEIVASQDLHRKVGETCGSEQYCGIDFWWEWITLEELENALKDWKDDIDLWVYSKSTILHDTENKIANLLAEYRQYPRSIWLEKLFLYWNFATGHAPYDSGKAIQRGDMLTAQLYLNQAMEYYTALVFILNQNFVPYRKWRLKEFQKLAYKPQNYEERLRKILTTVNWNKQEFEAKQNIVNDLVVELKEEMLKTGISKQRLENPWKFKVKYAPRI